MKLSKTLLATSIISILSLSLSGCGGSDDESPSKNEFVKTIKVIDGYLSEAEICIDENKNGICETSEKAGYTKEDGSFSLTETQLNLPIIANVISGKTKDSDISGLPVLQSYSMIASGQESVVTPFTTLAKRKNISTSALASELELPESVIAGDYIELKEDDTDGIKAHYIARALAAAKMPTDLDIVDKIVKESKTRILHSVNNNTLLELDNKLLIIDSDGKFVEKEQIKNLEQHLVEKNSWHNGSLNTHFLLEDGVQKVSFKDGSIHFYHNDGNVKESIKYQLEGNKLYTIIDNQKDESDEFVYTSDKLLLSIAEGVGDLIFWTEDDLSGSFSASNMTEDMFKGKTWYYLADDSTNGQPKIVLIELSFSNKEMVIIKEGDEVQEGTWSIVSETNEFGTHANLEIELSTGDDPMSLMLVTEGNELLLTSEGENKDQYSILTKDKDIIHGIYDVAFDVGPDIDIPPENVCKNPILWNGPISIQITLDAGRNKVIFQDEIPDSGTPAYHFEFDYGLRAEILDIDVEDLRSGAIFTYSGESKAANIGMSSYIGYMNPPTLFNDPLIYTAAFTLPNGDVITEKFVSDDIELPNFNFEILDCQDTGYYEFKIENYK
ncbi:hypothetical protein [Aliivibrio sp. 1S128]|uniref:hypothetical protein n=1 Tax=Aliivibrio sp. 1S128 TaxID=1840085 RepID=UPI00080E8442|nr:hypothetical protein [Aliivibrio sp. 1S128]OCH25161.1 hypothetical protein A6E03_05235 [Aliivibrio sp. 1S128]